ncbi:MAG TPA: hypothetical protein PK098_09225, partial [Phycisphaerales bacterium]|nr:hypothetical protein [Phycisphaerales bacterium]
VAIVLTMTQAAQSDVAVYSDKAAWMQAAGQVTNIDFVGYQFGDPVLPDHYAHLGATITGQQMGYYHTSAFVNDGEGIIADNHTLWVHFDEPQSSVAVDYPGGIRFQLYRKGELIYTSSSFTGSLGLFTGLISETPFDAVHLYRNGPSLSVAIDDLHFGPPIPAPGAMGVFALAALGHRRRRRHRSLNG